MKLNADINKLKFFEDYYVHGHIKNHDIIIRLSEFSDEMETRQLSEEEVIFLHYYKYTQCNIAKASALSKYNRMKVIKSAKNNRLFAQIVTILKEELKDLLEGVNLQMALLGDNMSKELALRTLAGERGYKDKEIEKKQIVGFDYIEVDVDEERKLQNKGSK